MMNLIFIGAPGVGKGTQSDFIKRDFSIVHISTGDMFRENISNNTELGKTAKSYMDRGDLVPDSLVVEMIIDRIKRDDCKNGFMLDGFPRTIEQANELDRILKELNFNISAIINLYADKDIIIQRLLSRGRDDDNEETIKNRIEVFEKQSKPVLDFYQGRVNTINIESVGTPEEVYSKIKQELDKINN